MSRKKANSNLPSELNENWGSNYMMDGFWHDMEYGHGLEENPGATPVPQPSSSGMSHLPSDVISQETTVMSIPDEVEQDIEHGMDLEGLEIVAAGNDRSDVGITDFSWFGDASQDPDRLPHNHFDIIPELQDAWGHRTDGLTRIDLVDRGIPQYEVSFQEGDHQVDKLAQLIRSAMRRSAAGDLTLAQQLVTQPKLTQPMTTVLAEHGLVGNVYVRGSAYPGLHRGKYAQAFKRAVRGCRYLIAEDTELTRDVAATQQLRVVSSPDEIDWKNAYQHYGPKLAATGRLKSAGNFSARQCRKRLRAAFLRDEVAPRTDIETLKPRHSMPADRVSAEQATRALVKFKPAQREVLSWVERSKKAEMQAAITKLGGWVKARLLSQEDARRLLKSEAAPQILLRTASALITAVKQGEYQGAGRNQIFHVLGKVAPVTRKDWETGLAKKAAESLAKDRALLVDRVTKLLVAGVLSNEQAKTLLATSTNSRDAMRLASKMASQVQTGTYNQGNLRHQGAAPSSSDADAQAVGRHVKQAKAAQEVVLHELTKAEQETQAKRAYLDTLLLKVGKIDQMVEKGVRGSKLKTAVRTSFSLKDLRLIQAHLDPILVRGGFYEKSTSHEYQGPVMTQAPSQTHEVAVNPNEVRKVARWVRQQMSEGSAGAQLDQLIQLRLTPQLKSASSKKVDHLRKVHEGLAGHLYVDAGAYGTKKGTKGCDQGALRHRANQLKFVLAQKQCQGCVFKNADGVCQKYNKLVVDEVPSENVEGYRQTMIASHSYTDQQMTADLFSVPSLAPAVDLNTAEYGLHNGALDDINTEDGPDFESIDGIFFGGFEL